ncbi:hypothetical protein ACE6H2_002038 [Prunus campanulata]
MYQVDATNLYTNEYREKEKKINANFFELDLQFSFARKDQVKMEVLKGPSLDCALLFLKILKNAKDLIFMSNFIQGKRQTYILVLHASVTIMIFLSWVILLNFHISLCPKSVTRYLSHSLHLTMEKQKHNSLTQITNNKASTTVAIQIPYTKEF